MNFHTKMYAKTVQITGKGQVVIPKEVRERLGLTKGSKLIMLQKDENIVMHKPEEFEKILEDFSEFTQASEKALADVWKDEKDDVWESYLRD